MPAKTLGLKPGNKIAFLDLDGVVHLSENERKRIAEERALREIVGGHPECNRLVSERFYTGYSAFSQKRHAKPIPGYRPDESIMREYLKRHFKKRVDTETAAALAAELAPIASKKANAIRNELSELSPRIGKIFAALGAKGYHRVLFTSRHPNETGELVHKYGLAPYLHGALFAAPLARGKTVAGLKAFGFNSRKAETIPALKEHFGKNIAIIDDSEEMVRVARKHRLKAFHVKSEHPEAFARLSRYIRMRL